MLIYSVDLYLDVLPIEWMSHVFGFVSVKNVVPQTLSPPGAGPWQQQSQQQPPSPSSASSGSTSPSAYSPSRTLDLSGSSTSFSSEPQRKASASHNWQNGPVHQWSKEQVSLVNFGHALEKII